MYHSRLAGLERCLLHHRDAFIKTLGACVEQEEQHGWAPAPGFCPVPHPIDLSVPPGACHLHLLTPQPGSHLTRHLSTLSHPHTCCSGATSSIVVTPQPATSAQPHTSCSGASASQCCSCCNSRCCLRSCLRLLRSSMGSCLSYILLRCLNTSHDCRGGWGGLGGGRQAGALG